METILLENLNSLYKIGMYVTKNTNYVRCYDCKVRYILLNK
jgi:hypothetical protein